MHRILFLPDIRPVGYPDNPKAGYRISGKGRIPDIRPDTWLDNYIIGKISNKYLKTALIILCPAALHTIANISMHISSISLIFLVSGILCILNLPREV
jgi:hypothetical protein